MKRDNNLLGVGILSAFSASLCCITPVLAFIAGTSGIASSFSWIEPFRPYFIVLSILVLGYAWFQKLNHKMDIGCNCDTPEKPKFIQTKKFLAMMTAFAILMLAFPYYSKSIYPKIEYKNIIVENSNIHKVVFKISGMTCSGCEEHVRQQVNKLAGIISLKASYDNGQTVVVFDNSKTNTYEIETAINATGYSVINKK